MCWTKSKFGNAYIDDHVNAFIEFMGSPLDLTGLINIGNPSNYSKLELSELSIRLAKSKSGINYKPLLADDPKQHKPDTALARSALNWQLKISLGYGLKSTIVYLNELAGA